MLLIITLLLVLLQFQPDSLKRTQVHATVSSGLIVSSGSSLPFWMHSNRLGTIDPRSANAFSRLTGNVHRDMTDNWHLNIGIDALARYSENPSIHAVQAYVSTTYRGYRLDVGRRSHPIGLDNHDIGVGSMMVSRNAIPVPAVTLSTPEFIDVPLTQGYLGFKAMFSHGQFGGSRFVADPYLHQKYLYLRLSIWKFSGYAGIVHNAQWGGESPVFGRAAQSFDDYLRVVTARPPKPSTGSPGFEQANALGNALGSYDFGLAYELPNVRMQLTRLFYLEDTVSRRFRSSWDGAWGANLSFHNTRMVQALTYQHVNTIKQDALPSEERGRADYYNHLIYRSGWSHQGRVLGIPLIGIDGRIDNNMLVAHHLGVRGDVGRRFRYRALGTYSRNYGTIGEVTRLPRGSIDFDARRKDQVSWLLETDWRLRWNDAFSVSLALAGDIGEYQQNQTAALVGLKWTSRVE